VAGVDWPGRLGRSGAAPLQNENGIPGDSWLRYGLHRRGTPSLLDPEHLRGILDTIRATFEGDIAEVTLERTLRRSSGEGGGLVQSGINRVSFGFAIVL